MRAQLAVPIIASFLIIGILGLSQEAFAATIDLTGTVRDFHFTHPDFEAEVEGLQTGQVSNNLGVDKNPVFVEPSKLGFHGTENFNQWYNDVEGINIAAPLTIILDNTITPDPNIFSFIDNDFFPIDEQLFGNEGNPHNYHFTYEIHSEFTYAGGETLSFTGDDDLWIFINDKLVIDLGGVHGPESDTVNLDEVAPSLGITIGETYDFDLFFAERHTKESTFQIETSIKLGGTSKQCKDDVKLQEQQCKRSAEEESKQCMDDVKTEREQCKRSAEAARNACKNAPKSERAQCMRNAEDERKQCISSVKAEEQQCKRSAEDERKQCISDAKTEREQCKRIAEDERKNNGGLDVLTEQFGIEILNFIKKFSN